MHNTNLEIHQRRGGAQIEGKLIVLMLRVRVRAGVDVRRPARPATAPAVRVTEAEAVADAVSLQRGHGNSGAAIVAAGANAVLGGGAAEPAARHRCAIAERLAPAVVGDKTAGPAGGDADKVEAPRGGCGGRRVLVLRPM